MDLRSDSQGFIIGERRLRELRDGINRTQADMQAIIAAFEMPMPNLLPVQFNFLLAKYGFDDVIDSLLIALKNEDIDKYAMYKSYLNAARFYEFDKVLIMFNEILDKFAAIDPALALSDEQLRVVWLEASQI